MRQCKKCQAHYQFKVESPAHGCPFCGDIRVALSDSSSVRWIPFLGFVLTFTPVVAQALL